MSAKVQTLEAQVRKAPALRCEDIHKGFPGPDGQFAPVIEGLTFTAEPGQFVAILGPSGAGKSTLLRCISGLDSVDSGTVSINDVATTGVADETAVVFQDYSKSLFPWLTLEKNVMFGLHDLSRGEARDRARSALQRVGLGEYTSHYPWQISGGMQQRTAIARAIAREAHLVVFDEPFAAVDALTRINLEDGLAELWADLGFTSIFVTHDVEEAIYLADKVIVLGPRPTYVALEFDVDLPRPRDQLSTRALAKFQEYRSAALETLGVTH